MNLLKRLFSFNMYKLQKDNKIQLISDLQSSFQLIKLRAHFNNETCITKINQMNEQVLLMMKNVPKEMYHTVSKYIDLLQMVPVH